MSATDDTCTRSERARRFGELMFRRATGAAPEMQCARTLAGLVARTYWPGMRILDAGCGAGHYLRSLRARVDPDIDYRGVDLNPEYIDLARRAHGDSVPFHVADIAALPFADSTFDVVFAANVLPNLPPPPTRAIAELVRVARHQVLLRVLFGPLNYVIREFEPDPEDRPHLDDARAIYHNIYSEAFYRSMVRAIDPALSVDIIGDEGGAALVGDRGDEAWQTRVVDGRQIAGQLVLDWRYLVLGR